MTLVTKLPTRRRLVVAAVAASVVQHSSNGSVRRPRLTKWSHDHAVEKPAASTRAALSSHQRRRDADGRQVDPDRDGQPRRPGTVDRGSADQGHRERTEPASSATRMIVSVARSRSSRLR